MAASPQTLRGPFNARKLDPVPQLASDSPNTIGLKRRESASFKTMSTGSLVSNSPFTRSSASTPSPAANLTTPPPSPTRIPAAAAVSRAPTTPSRLTSTPSAPSFLYSTSRAPVNVVTTTARKPSNENENTHAVASPEKPALPHNPQPSSIGAASTTASSTSPATPFRPTRRVSPLLPPPAPYEIPSLTKEQAPFYNQPPSRRVAGAAHTPAISPRRLRGPREQTPEQESSNVSRSPTKTVTWAATEEVLEFEVEEDRRTSGASSVSYGSRSAGSDDEELYGDGYPYGYGSDEDVTFEEGGSLVLHDLSSDHLDHNQAEYALNQQSRRYAEDDDTESAVSSTVQDINAHIDSLMGDQDARSLADTSTGEDDFFRSPIKTSAKPTTSFFESGNPTSAFSDVTAASDMSAVSESSYDSEGDELEEGEKIFFSAQPPPALKLAPASLAPAITTSTYSLLPNLPDNSPFMAFEDNGEASSVVTLDLGSKVVPPPARQSFDSPILHSFKAPSQSAPVETNSKDFANELNAPSRAGTAVKGPSSTVSSSAGSSATTSSISRFAARADGLYSQLAANERRINETSAPSVPTITSNRRANVTTPTTSPPLSAAAARAGTLSPSPVITDVFSPLSGISTVEKFPTPPAFASRTTPPNPPAPIITARPAEKAVPATLNQGMVNASPTKGGAVVGNRITTALAEGFASPLELLGKQKWSPANEAPRIDEKKQLVADEEAEDEVLTLKPHRKPPPATTHRRRSRSTGDVRHSVQFEDDKEVASTSMDRAATAPEIDYANRLDGAMPAITNEFSTAVEASLTHVFDNRNRGYKIREHTRVIHAYDEPATVGAAGDVDPGKAWRKKRPSDMHMVRSKSAASLGGGKTPKDPLAGLLFVSLVNLSFESSAIPSNAVVADLFVCNGKAPPLRVHEFRLAPTVTIGKKLELDTSTELAFHLEVLVPKLGPPPTTAPANVTPPPSPSKNKFRAFFSSPLKRSPKKVASAPSLRDQSDNGFRAMLSSKGSLGQATVTFADQAERCKAKTATLRLPLQASVEGAAQSKTIGTITLELFWLPRIKGFVRAGLPKFREEVIAGLAAAQRQLTTHHEGVLTQQGGDCTTWRRRQCKLRGMTLIPYSEVTKRATVEIDLYEAVAVVDPDEPVAAPTPSTTKSTLTRSSSQTQELEEDLYRMDNSFKLLFADGNGIDFFADSAEEKKKWVEVLKGVVGQKGGRTPAPEWAVRYHQMALAPAPVS